MAVQTYCTILEVEQILSEHGVTAYVDDKLCYERDTDEDATALAMIERAAEMVLNFRLCNRYLIPDLSGNSWCKWANATIAAMYTATRRNNPTPESLQRDVEEIYENLRQIANGWMKLPNQRESFDMSPAVTNYDVERIRSVQPVRVVVEESTRPRPAGTPTKRRAARPIRYIY